MKIMIIRVNQKVDPDELTLKECGFKLGDIFDIVSKDDVFNDRSLCIASPRTTDKVNAGEWCSINENEYEVIS